MSEHFGNKAGTKLNQGKVNILVKDKGTLKQNRNPLPNLKDDTYKKAIILIVASWIAEPFILLIAIMLNPLYLKHIGIDNQMVPNRCRWNTLIQLLLSL